MSSAPPQRDDQAGHVSIPSAAGVHRRIRRRQSSTISASIRSPSAAVAVVGSPSTPSSLTAATPPLTHRGQQLGQRRAVACAPAGRCAHRPAKYAAILKFRCARHGRRRRRPRTDTTPRLGLRDAAAATAWLSAAMLPPWPLTNSSRCAQQVADLPYSTSSAVNASVPIEIVPGKLWCSPLAPYAIAGAANHVRSGSSDKSAATAPATADSDPGVGVQRQVRAVLLGRADGDSQPYWHALQLARRRAPEIGLDYHSAMVRRIHLPCTGCWRFRKRFFPPARSLKPVNVATSATSASTYPLVSVSAAGLGPARQRPSARVKPSGTRTSSAVQVVHRRAAEAHQGRVDSAAQDVEHVLDARLARPRPGPTGRPGRSSPRGRPAPAP